MIFILCILIIPILIYRFIPNNHMYRSEFAQIVVAALVVYGLILLVVFVNCSDYSGAVPEGIYLLTPISKNSSNYIAVNNFYVDQELRRYYECRLNAQYVYAKVFLTPKLVKKITTTNNTPTLVVHYKNVGGFWTTFYIVRNFDYYELQISSVNIFILNGGN